jgi:hypothetical protein
MKRLVIITVGKTHSGKTTFAKALEQQLHNSLVIDQDNHASTPIIKHYCQNKDLIRSSTPSLKQLLILLLIRPISISFFATQIALAMVGWICLHIFKMKALSVSSSFLIFQLIFFMLELLKVNAAQLYLGVLLLLRKYLIGNRMSLI